jgi:hypothetical protein
MSGRIAPIRGMLVVSIDISDVGFIEKIAKP